MMKRLAIMIALAAALPAMAQDEPAPKPVPIGNPGAWIPMEAYPPAAKASAEEGRVAFTLDVDNAGHVNVCKVTTSSGSPLLDDTTCNLMTANGRFTPPKDKKGKPVESRWSSSVRWKLEAATPPPAAEAAAPVPPAHKP
jgi:TonB family protein